MAIKEKNKHIILDCTLIEFYSILNLSSLLRDLDLHMFKEINKARYNKRGGDILNYSLHFFQDNEIKNMLKNLMVMLDPEYNVGYSKNVTTNIKSIDFFQVKNIKRITSLIKSGKNPKIVNEIFNTEGKYTAISDSWNSLKYQFEDSHKELGIPLDMEKLTTAISEMIIAIHTCNRKDFVTSLGSIKKA